MKENISRKKLRQFGIVIGLCIPIFIGWLIPMFWGHIFRLWTLWLGLPLLILGLIRPKILYYPYKVWMAIGHILGWINSRIILGFVFIFVLLPIALIMRTFGYDPLKQNQKGKISNSFRELKNHKIDLTRIF